MQIGNCNDKNLSIQCLVYDSVRKTTQLTAAGDIRKRVPGLREILNPVQSVKHLDQKLITSPADSAL
jgi:hypothetical protein